MRLRTVLRTLLVGLLSLSVFGLQSPAEATTTGALAFQGTAKIIGGGLSVPPADPGGILDPLTHGPARDWLFSSDVCVSVGVNGPDKPKDPESGTGPGCTIGASGSLNGWCGRSHGTGSGVYTDAAGQSFSFTLKWNSVGGTLVITGTITKDSTQQTGDLNAVVQATPSVGSCLDGTAEGFLVTGLASAVVS